MEQVWREFKAIPFETEWVVLSVRSLGFVLNIWCLHRKSCSTPVFPLWVYVMSFTSTRRTPGKQGRVTCGRVFQLQQKLTARSLKEKNNE